MSRDHDTYPHLPALPRERAAIAEPLLERVTRAVADILAEAPLDVLQRASAAPTGAGSVAELISSLAEASPRLAAADPEAAAIARAAAIKQEILEVTPTFSTAEVARILGLTAEGVRKRRLAGRVLALPVGREGAFAETFLRTLPARFISRADADRRSVTTIRLARKLRACLFHGKGLPRLGATAAITAGGQSAARIWSHAIWERFSQVDAIRYHTRHDNDELALAVFDRASSALQVVDSVGIRADREWFASVLLRYRLGLLD